MAQRQVYQKICMLGMFGVGKTSLVRRFVYDKYDDEYKSTIGVKVSQKLLPPITLPDNHILQYNFLIWDIEGSEKMTPQIENYLIGAHAALILCDLSRPESVELVPSLVKTYTKIASNAQIVIVGNKFDLIDEKCAALSRLEEIATTEAVPFLLTSAKDGMNVEACFKKLGLLLASV